MFLSFLIPVFNAEPYIEECINSLYAQDLPEQEYEILCIDDASADRSAEILRRLMQTHANLHLFSQEHKGVSAARNLGMQHAKGDYIWFVDADDFIAPQILSEIKKLCTEQQPDKLSFGAYTFFQELNKEEQEQIHAGTLRPNSGASAVTVWGSVFRKAFLDQTGVKFHVGIVNSEDTLFLCELSAFSPKEMHLDKTVYFWRKNPGSSTMGTRINNYDKKLDSYLHVIPYFRDYYREKKGDVRLCADYLMSNLWAYMQICTGLGRKEYRSRVRQARQAGIFPIRRPRECTLTRSYMTTRTDLLGKIYELIYMHQHRRWGVWGMRLYHLLAGRKKG